MGSSRVVLIACAAVVGMVTFLAFLPAVGGEWLNWDDDVTYLENDDWRGMSGESLAWMFTTAHFGHYRPVTWLTLAMDYEVWGMDARGYHLTSNLIHAAGAVVLLFLARRLLAIGAPAAAEASPGSVTAAAVFAALVFGVHPLRVEGVAWLTARMWPLAGVFVAGSALAYVEAAWQGARGRGMLAGACALYALSLLSLAIGIAFPFVLLVLDVYPLKRLRADPRAWVGREGRAILMEKVPFLALAAGALGLAFLAKRQYLVDPGGIAAGQRVLPALYGLTFYVKKTVFPVALLPLYQLRWDISALVGPAIVSGVVALVITAAVIALRRRAPYGAAAWAAYLLLLAPVLGIVRSGPQLVADRYGYLPGMTLAVLAGAGLLCLVRRGAAAGRRSAVTVATIAGALAVAGILFGLTWRQCGVWRSSRRVWEHTLKYDARCTVAYLNLADVCMKEGDTEGAIRHLERAIAANPKYAKAYNNLGAIYEKKGDAARAEREYQNAIAADASYAMAYYNLGNIYGKRSELGRAAALYEQSIAWDPDYAPAHNNLGNVRRLGGDVDGAIASYRRAVRAEPDHASSWRNLGDCLAGKGDFGGAADAYGNVLRVNPGDAEARERLRRCLARVRTGR